MFECEHPQYKPHTKPRLNLNSFKFKLIFNISLCSSISLECLEGIPCGLWGPAEPLDVLGNFGIGMQGMEQPHLRPAKCHLCKVPFVGAGKEGRELPQE